MNPVSRYNLSFKDLRLLWAVFVACRDHRLVQVDYLDDRGKPQELRGTARHIVSPTHDGFPDFITPECRLRVSGILEHFITLHDIEDIHLLDSE